MKDLSGNVVTGPIQGETGSNGALQKAKGTFVTESILSSVLQQKVLLKLFPGKTGPAEYGLKVRWKIGGK